MRKIVPVCCVMFLFWGCAHEQEPATVINTPGPIISPARWDHQAIRLLAGRVLVVGGMENDNIPGGEIILPDAGLTIDPSTGDVQATGPVSQKLWRNTATLLRDGRVLIAGGQSLDPSVIALDHAEIFDPAKNQFETTANPMLFARHTHTATLLANGMVLLAGGDGPYVDLVRNGCELFDPATETFLGVQDMRRFRTGHTATLLDSGHVLVAGGVIWFGPHHIYPEEAELFDPASSAFRIAHDPYPIPYSYQDSALKLHSGKVLLISMSSNVASLYNPVTEGFEETGAMIHKRLGATYTFLEETGEVLVAGGYIPNSAFTPVMEMEIYDPDTGRFVECGTLLQPRYFHTATLLPGNKVLLVGGLGSDGKPIGQCVFVEIK